MCTIHSLEGKRKGNKKRSSVRVDWRSLTDGQEITWREIERERGGGGEREIERGVKKLKTENIFFQVVVVFEVGKSGDTLCCV
jgi:hypothetical protein